MKNNSDNNQSVYSGGPYGRLAILFIYHRFRTSETT